MCKWFITFVKKCHYTYITTLAYCDMHNTYQGTLTLYITIENIPYKNIGEPKFIVEITKHTATRKHCHIQTYFQIRKSRVKTSITVDNTIITCRKYFCTFKICMAFTWIRLPNSMASRPTFVPPWPTAPTK